MVRVDAIGDLVIWSDAARELRTLYTASQWEISLLGNLAWGDLARELPCFDRVLTLDRARFVNSLSYRLSLLKALRREGFHAVVQPTFSREFFVGDEIVRISGAPERIGSSGDSVNTGRLAKCLSDRCYTRLVPAAPVPLMELERNAEFMRGLGLGGFRASLPDLRFLLKEFADPAAGNFYVLVPGAGAALKRWPRGNFLEVARRLHRLTGWRGIVCGSADEQALAEYLVREAGVPLVSLAGRTPLSELARVLAGARVVVGNDSSAVHLAAALAAPAVCLLGGGQYGRFLPYLGIVASPDRPLPVPVMHRMDCFCCDWRCSKRLTADGAAPCVAQIAVDEVMDAVATLLSQGGIPAGAHL